MRFLQSGGRCCLVVGIVAFISSCTSAPAANTDPARDIAEAPAALVAPDATAADAEDPLETTSQSGDVLFACRTAQDKVIEVYDMGASIEYVFGPKEQPELVLNVPREQVSTYQWRGIGRYAN